MLRDFIFLILFFVLLVVWLIIWAGLHLAGGAIHLLIALAVLALVIHLFRRVRHGA